MTISASTINSALICSRVRFTFSLLCEYGSLRNHYATLSKKLKCTPGGFAQKPNPLLTTTEARGIIYVVWERTLTRWRGVALRARVREYNSLTSGNGLTGITLMRRELLIDHH
jgi:hypothetical protein